MSENKVLLTARNLTISYRNERILTVPAFTVKEGDRIGVIGANGAGKSTLLNLLSGKVPPDTGSVKRFCSVSYAPQRARAEFPPDPAEAKRFSAPEEREHLSGGESARRKIASALSPPAALLFLDEPTADLDTDGIRLLTARIASFPGGVVTVSHDRALLNVVCTAIAEVKDRTVTIYPENYDTYAEELRKREKNQTAQHEKYVRERESLTKAARESAEKATGMRKAPKRMGNSEARLHKRESGGKKCKVEAQKKALLARLSRLEAVPEVQRPRPHLLPVPALALPNRFAVSAECFTLAVPGRTLLSGARFAVPTGSKTALLGKNGAGKTCLFAAIYGKAAGIILPPKAVLARFRQDLAIEREEQTALQCALEGAAQSETAVRMMLANLSLARSDLDKRLSQLSGGERVKVLLVRALAARANVLLLDEPTNFLDVHCMEALAAFLAEYPGTVLFTSHDLQFVRDVATYCLKIENGTIAECGTP